MYVFVWQSLGFTNDSGAAFIPLVYKNKNYLHKENLQVCFRNALRLEMCVYGSNSLKMLTKLPY